MFFVKLGGSTHTATWRPPA